ncbi:hypothetical protein [Micromonospora sp. CB01531]|uniref:hypothetical protein n=1 Tax=Micromonospora sp. CB01531 TaxID=1718947 RepID=UPI000ACC4F22|nr:hypothetical protein [Micromonospora sp. CB01531]
MRAMLADQVGIDPDRVGPVLDLAALRVVNNAWRNSPVEDWHAGDGPLSDGDMLCINSHTCWRVRQIIRRWRREVGLATDADTGQLDDVSVDDWDWLAARIWRWLVNPQRLPPGGLPLVEVAGDDLADFSDQVAGDDLADFSDHVAGELGGWAAAAEERGGRHAAWRAAAHGGLACHHWWGTPTWPSLVDDFVTALDEPSHRHWGPDGQRRRRLQPEPAQVADRGALRKTLLREPWALQPVAAQWVVAAGIGYLQPDIPPLPTSADTSTSASGVS